MYNIKLLLLLTVLIVIIITYSKDNAQENMTNNTEAIANIASIYNTNNMTLTNANITSKMIANDLNVTGETTVDNLDGNKVHISNLQLKPSTNGNSSMTIPAGKYSYKIFGGGDVLSNNGGVSENGFDIYQYDPNASASWILKNDKNNIVTFNNEIKIDKTMPVTNSVKGPSIGNWSGWADGELKSECPPGYYCAGLGAYRESDFKRFEVICKKFPFYK